MKITAWSFSRYNTYVQCPARARYLYLDKLKEPGSPAMERGSDIHDMAAQYIKGQVAELPKELSLFPSTFNQLRKAFKDDPTSVVVEDTWAFRKDWTRTTWDDWDGCWLRVKLDVAYIANGTVTIIDWKTGKFSPQFNLAQYMLQLELYALASLLIYPDLRVIPKLCFLDHELAYPDEEKVYEPKDLSVLKAIWEKNTKPMLSDQQFAPRPNNLCRFCSFRASAGGPCVY